MSDFAIIAAVGEDRPGIIASLAQAVYELGANLEDATMTRLHGAFAAMLAVKLPADVTPDQARAALEPIGREAALELSVRSVGNHSIASAPPDHVLTVYGADRTGIVFSVARLLAEKDVNITDMDTRVSGTTERPVYIMVLEIAAGDADLGDELAQLALQLDVEIALQPLETEAL